MKTLITARFDKSYLNVLETITKNYEFAGYGVTGEKMPVPEMKEKIRGIELLISDFEDINQEVIEAARLDNIPLWKIFRDMVVPMSSATGIYVFITTIVQGLQYVFTPIKVVTQGGPNYASSNLIYMSYHEAFTLYRTGTSSAVSVITMVLFIVLLLLEFRFVEKGVYYEN